jgi:hypothetical protein
MKRILFSFLMISGSCLSALAQAPQVFNYQGVARATDGEPLENQNINIQFQIHSGSLAGTVVYEETHQTTTNELGLFTLLIGQGDFPSSDFSAIDWGGNSYYLQVLMDPAGGGSYQDMGTAQLLSVPYALYAASSGGGGGSGPWQTTGNNISNTNSGAVGIGTSTPDYPLSFASTVGGKVSLFGGSSGTHYGLGIQSNLLQVFADQSISDIAFGYGSSTAFTERMRVKGSGNVGIGTASPTAKLHVDGNVLATGEVNRTATGAANMVPIAYGTVSAAGTLVSSSSSNNVSATWVTSPNRYEITITGENFSLTDGYVATVTPQSIPYTCGTQQCNRPTIANVRSASNKLQVVIYNAEEMPLISSQAGFSFVVYKP